MALADENGTYDMPLANAASAVHEAQRFLKVVWYRKNTVVVVGVVVDFDRCVVCCHGDSLLPSRPHRSCWCKMAWIKQTVRLGVTEAVSI